MNRTMKMAAAFALAAACMSSAAMAGEKPIELTATQLQAAQTRTYSVPKDIAFSATVAALQTLGYIDITASKDAGTISGHTETKGKMIYNILWGVGKKKLTQKASILIEQNSDSRSVVRLNLHQTEAKSRGLFGTAFSDGKLVATAEPYAAFFTALDAEVSRREPQVAPAAAASPAAAPAAPAGEAPAATPSPAAAPAGN